MNDSIIKDLIINALSARKYSYCPYSKFAVGAALMANGIIYTGCNIENASYGATNCAERTAVFKAVSEGVRIIDAIAVVGSSSDCDPDNMNTYAYPCGVCRQVLREFSNPSKLTVIVAKSVEDYKIYTLEELLPESFGPENLV